MKEKRVYDTGEEYLNKEGLPKGFKEGTCKCGNKYGYCGLDIGHCVKCLDAMEKKK